MSCRTQYRTPPGPPAPSIAHVANADRQQQAACQSGTILARFPAWIGSNMGNPSSYQQTHLYPRSVEYPYRGNSQPWRRGLKAAWYCEDRRHSDGSSFSALCAKSFSCAKALKGKCEGCRAEGGPTRNFLCLLPAASVRKGELYDRGQGAASSRFLQPAEGRAPADRKAEL